MIDKTVELMLISEEWHIMSFPELTALSTDLWKPPTLNVVLPEMQRKVNQ